jgi:uncharacterized membrane protein YfcA
MSLIVVATALPARLLGVPLDDLVAELDVIVNLLAGSLLGAWLGATWATRMTSATLYRVIAALLVLIALALAANHVGTIPPLDLATGAQVAAGVAAGLAIGIVAALMGVAGGELLIPTIVLLYGVDLKLAGSLSLAVSLPTMLVASLATAATAASSSCASIAALSSRWRRGLSPEPLSVAAARRRLGGRAGSVARCPAAGLLGEGVAARPRTCPLDAPRCCFEACSAVQHDTASR